MVDGNAPGAGFTPVSPDYEPFMLHNGIGFWQLTFGPEGLPGSLLMANRSFMEMFPDDWRGSAMDFTLFVKRWVHHDDQETVLNGLASTYLSGEYSYRMDHRMSTKDRLAWFWVQAAGYVGECDETGRPRRLHGAIVDIQGRMLAKAELEKALESEKTALLRIKRERERLAAVIGAASLGSWNWNIQTGRVVYNRRWAEIIGRNIEDIAPTVETWREAVWPEDLPQAVKAIEDHCAGLADHYEAEFRVRRPDGSIIWAQDRGRAVEYDDQGRPLKLMGVLLDISRQKNAERLLLEKMEEMELVLKAANIGSWDWNIQEKNVKFSDLYLGLLGYGQEDMNGSLEDWERLVHPDDLARASAALERLLAGEDSLYAQEIRMRHKDGRYIWIYDFGKVVEWDEQRRPLRALGGQLDFDQRKKMEMDFQALREQEMEMRLARDLAEESARSKSEFLANMSHEIRTPMNAILGLTHLALETDLNEQQYEYVYRTEVAAKNLLRIINDILDFSKIEAGKLEMEDLEFHLGDTLNASMELLADKAHAKGLEFALDLPAELHRGLMGDPVRLTQIINNLISNAIKFTAEGSIIVRVAALESSAETFLLRFTVEDSGIGVTEEQTRRLFNPFTQADASTTRKYGGTGLGLAISKRLAEMMGGEIWAQGRPGQGSVFGFTARFKPCGMVSEKGRQLVTPGSFKGLRALAVDDNPPALAILAESLKVLGFETLQCGSGEKAVEIFKAEAARDAKLDLIMVDWKMPTWDGLETIRRLSQEATGRPLPSVLMVTGYDRDEAAAEARAQGVAIRQALTKPISMSSLNDALMDLFGRSKLKSGKKKAGASEDDLQLIEPLRGSRILLAEDNEVNQLVASRILTNAGFKVEIAGNGLEALEMLERDSFDLVLMDIQMPEMDGLTAAGRLRAQPKFQDLPILAMTAHAMSGDRELSLKAGMNDHINKPINVSELFQAMARWLKPRGPAA